MRQGTLSLFSVCDQAGSARCCNRNTKKVEETFLVQDWLRKGAMRREFTRVTSVHTRVSQALMLLHSLEDKNKTFHDEKKKKTNQES